MRRQQLTLTLTLTLTLNRASSNGSLYEILSVGEGAMDQRFKAHQTAGKAVRQAVKALNLSVRH